MRKYYVKIKEDIILARLIETVKSREDFENGQMIYQIFLNEGYPENSEISNMRFDFETDIERQKILKLIKDRLEMTKFIKVIDENFDPAVEQAELKKEMEAMFGTEGKKMIHKTAKANS